MPSYTSYKNIEYSFKKKAKNFGDLAKYLAVRAAQKIQDSMWKETKTLPKEAPYLALIYSLDEFKNTFWFEYDEKDFMIIVEDFSYDQETKRCSGICHLWINDD